MQPNYQPSDESASSVLSGATTLIASSPMGTRTRVESVQSLLAIDDDEAELEILADALQHAFPGARVQSVTNPLDAAEICLATRFDCVLIDYNMPQIDGMTAAAALRAVSPFLPIILMTRFGDEMLAARALRSGVSDYIPKSRINADSIRRSVQRSIHTANQARLINEQQSDLETFAYALAHDFKQPIRQITTFSQMIKVDMAAGKPDGVSKHLDFLCHAARRLNKLVDVMSQYTLLNQPPEMGEVDLDEVIAGLRASIAPFLHECGGELLWDGKTVSLWGNEPLTTQIVQNLVINGLTYNASPTPRVTVSTRVEGDHCIILVEDNGIGIEPAYIGEIFKPLVRLHAETEYSGTGLGLTLARKAVVSQGGAIWCESEPGAGSRFFVKLPVRRAAAVPG